ncbi:M24 family metallopeptidase [Paraburkholderia sp. MM5477-R1]|uniref:M24 family metallopeptidase n=1 Tax=Paraburkholderia sp. MM5477-R1 TaxID=2991062 RepID=UPI003D1FF4F9
MAISLPEWPSQEEVGGRIERLRENLATGGLDALVVTSQHNFEYYTGFRTLFWLSDTRPLFAVVRRDKPGVTIVASRIEEKNEHNGRNPRVRPVFYDGFTDDAIRAVGQVLSELPSGSAIGFDYGRDMLGRGSVALIDSLRGETSSYRLTDAADLIWTQRMVKSDHELQAVKNACYIATTAFFEGLPDLRIGMTEYAFGQQLKQRMIGLGADSVDWLPVRFGRGGRSYAQPNSGVRLELDDFVWADIGVRRADQISDLCRVAKVGKATAEQEDLYGYVRGVTLRLAEGIRPGMTGHDAFVLFERLWSERQLARISSAGRVGHGSGIALTEPPSLMAGSTEVILEDMVLHVEPKLEAAGGVFQVEEVFRVTSSGPEFLSPLAPERLPIVEL